jgi:cell division protein FtsI (penicillin-binding protein 3)
VVSLDEPSVAAAGGGESRTAGATAAPVAAALVHRLSPMLGLRPDNVTLPVIAARPDDGLKVVSN